MQSTLWAMEKVVLIDAMFPQGKLHEVGGPEVCHIVGTGYPTGTPREDTRETMFPRFGPSQRGQTLHPAFIILM